jgi:hypothetical protein
MTKLKTGGRKKGTPNKDTREIRDNFQTLIEGNIEQLQQDLKDMSAKDRVKAILDLARFVIPTLKAVEQTTTQEHNIQPLIINLAEGIDPNHF